MMLGQLRGASGRRPCWCSAPQAHTMSDESEQTPRQRPTEREEQYVCVWGARVHVCACGCMCVCVRVSLWVGGCVGVCVRISGRTKVQEAGLELLVERKLDGHVRETQQRRTEPAVQAAHAITRQDGCQRVRHAPVLVRRVGRLRLCAQREVRGGGQRIHTHTHIHTYIHTHIHTHTNKQDNRRRDGP
jgi:ABC-type nickel/cobalt efflux system permease component RcnA